MQPKTSKNKRTGTAGKSKREITFPLEKQNFMIIGIGIIVLIVGYALMSQNSVDGFLPTVAAPIILLAGYCVIIPYGILKNVKKTQEAAANLQQNTESTAAVSSNIKTS